MAEQIALAFGVEIDQDEREMIAARTTESRVGLKARGRRIAGAVPFGYDADPRPKQLVLNANEPVVVKVAIRTGCRWTETGGSR